MSTVQQLYRYPVKGLSPEPLPSVALQTGRGFPLDREFAITNGAWPFDAALYTPRPKTDFLALMQHEKLAALRTRFDESAQQLAVTTPARDSFTVDFNDADSLAAFSDFLERYLAGALPGRPQLVRAEGFRFTDVSVLSPTLMSSVSLINLATVREFAGRLGAPVDPLRFRGNIYFEGEPWEELDWMAREIRIGDATARVLLRTPRCAATNVDPQTAVRDLRIPHSLIEHYGHRDLGVYAEIVAAGEVKPGAAIGPA